MPAAILPAVSPDTLAASQRVQRLRVAAATAVDPFARAPWTAAPAYAAATAYVVGAVVASEGRLYVAANAGTTPAAPQAPSHVDGSAVNDGAVLWTYAGPAPEIPADPARPTITVTPDVPALSSTIAAIGSSAPFVPGALRAVGGEVFAYGGYPGLRTLDRGPDVVGQHVGWEFETDEDALSISIFGAYAPVQLVIDGRRWSPGGLLMPGGGENYIDIAFPGQERRTRRFRIELGNTQSALHDVRIASTGQVWAPADAPVRAVFIADSILEGSSFGPFIAGGSVAQRVAGALGWGDPWDFSIGGTGYVVAGPGFRTYGERVAEALTRAPDVWVFMGSGNDAAQAPAAITAAALATFRAVRAGSSAPIIVFGVWPKDGAAGAVEAAVKAAFDAFADPASAWIPIANDPSGVPWITGPWNNAAHPASSNAGQLIGGDGTHPVDGGTAYLARRMVRAIRAEVLPKL